MTIEMPRELLAPARRHDLERLRASLFAVALMFGAADALLDRVVLARTGLDLVLAPAAAGCLVVAAIITHRSARIPRTVAWAAALGAAAYVFVTVTHVLFGAAAGQDLLVQAAVFAPWGPVLLTITTVPFPRGAALQRTSAIYYAALLIPGIISVASGHASPGALAVVVSLGLASSATSTLLGRLARLQELHARAQALREATELLGQTDLLTGLPNRARITEQLEREIKVAQRHRRPLAVILLDLDHFRTVNDHHGYSFGNQVLIEMAKRTQDCLRQTDLVGRWGGEEFLVVTPDANGANAVDIAGRIRRALEGVPFSERNVVQTASVGGAALQGDDTPASLLTRAETAVRLAKSAGGNRVAFE